MQARAVREAEETKSKGGVFPPGIPPRWEGSPWALLTAVVGFTELRCVEALGQPPSTCAHLPAGRSWHSFRLLHVACQVGLGQPAGVLRPPGRPGALCSQERALLSG